MASLLARSQIQLAVFESLAGCVESKKIGQVILNMASYAAKVTEQRLSLPISGGYSQGELSVTLRIKNVPEPNEAGLLAETPISQSFGWSQTKRLLSSLKRAYGLSAEEEEEEEEADANASDADADAGVGGEEEGRGEPSGGEAETETDKGHKRKPSRSLFARMQQDESSDSGGDEEGDVGSRGGNQVAGSVEGEDDEPPVGRAKGQTIPGRKRTKSNPALMPNSPGQIEALELVRKFQEGRNPMKKLETLEGSWERMSIHGFEADISFASIDQCSEEANGHAACSTLAIAIASWMRRNSDSAVPDREGELDQLIREGSGVWREIFADDTDQALLTKFPDMHLDLETATRFWAEKKCQPTCIDDAKSFIGFLMPSQDQSRSKWLKDATDGFLIFDEILDQAIGTSAREQGVYVVAWNDHFFVIRICSLDLIYLVDTLGHRLCDGCSRAFVVRFQTDSAENARGRGDESDSEEASDDDLEMDEDEGEDDDDDDEGKQKKKKAGGGGTAKEKCTAFVRNVLARSTLDQVVSNLSALELSGKEADAAKEGGGDGDCDEEGLQQMHFEWQFLLERLQVELQFIA